MIFQPIFLQTVFKFLEQKEVNMNELEWFYFTIIINMVIGFATYYASKRDRKKRINEYKKYKMMNLKELEINLIYDFLEVFT